MPSDWASASTAGANARISSPRWKKPSSGPLQLPRTAGDGSQRLNLSPRGPMPSRSELKRRLRASAEAAALALSEAEAARGSHATVPLDGGLGDDGQRLGPAGVRIDVGHGMVHGRWSGADEVTLLAAAAAFRERTGRAPRRPDAGELFDAIKGSVSPDIDEAKAFDRLNGFESEFLQGRLSASGEDPHGRRIRDLCAGVWGSVDLAPPPEDNSAGEEAGEMDADDEQRGATERIFKSQPSPRRDAQSPSEGPSSSAMDVDVVPALPSPSRSMKQRSLHPDPEPSADDGQTGRVPSPRRLVTSADIATLAHAAAAAARGSGDTTVPVDGEHIDFQSHRIAETQRLERADHGSARNSRKAWNDADEVALLNAAVAFRKRTGRAPRLHEDAGVLLSSIRGNISPHIDEAKASYKLCRFRSMFRHEAPGEHATDHDRRVHDLSARVWGPSGVARDNQGAVMPVVRQVLGEFWKVNERAMAGLPLEKGLSLLGKREARMIETKWRQQLDGEIQTQMQRHDLAKEICGMLNDTVMDLDI